jgi:hypothetical protein
MHLHRVAPKLGISGAVQVEELAADGAGEVLEGMMGGEALTSLRLRRLGSGVAPKSSGEPAGPLLRFELMVANLSTFATEGI